MKISVRLPSARVQRIWILYRKTLSTVRGCVMPSVSSFYLWVKRRMNLVDMLSDRELDEARPWIQLQIEKHCMRKSGRGKILG